MNFIAIDRLEPDREKLLLFLEALRDEAEEDAHPKYASISVATRAPDPLAVLATIYEDNQHHYYMEQPDAGTSLMAAEAVALYTGSGAGRFAAGQVFADEVLEHMTLVGNADLPYAGPTFWLAYGFADEDAESPFAAATVFLPHWQVARHSGGATAVANICVDVHSDLPALADRLLSAYAKFDDLERTPVPDQPLAVADVRPPVSDAYRGAVARAVDAIAAGTYRKIVLARSHTISGRFHPVAILNRLRQRFSGCYSFSYAAGTSAAFIGATPERLLSIRSGCLHTVAIAGTAPRNEDPAADAELGRALLNDPKELHEHRIVIASILKRLEALGLSAQTGQTGLLPLSNVQHLHTPVEAPLPPELHPLQIAQSLHPTPAVGGQPREAALPHIHALENLSRGLYAGFSGYFNWKGDADLIVGLRSAIVQPDSLTAYAGAGIVADSIPEKEEAETRLKLSAILHSLA